MFISMLVRRLKPGKTYDDFVAASSTDETVSRGRPAPEG